MFSPHHNFKNCKKLRKLILNLQASTNIPSTILEGHKKYHYAVFHKLKSTEYYTENLSTILSNPTHALESDFFTKVNRNLDGFFHCGGGALDILAREILVYFNINLPQNVYYRTAREKLFPKIPPRGKVIRYLDEPGWKETFSTYRNVCTHELLIVGSFNLNVIDDGGIQIKKIILPLPDNPRAAPSERTYRHNPDVLIYCKKTLKRLLSLINLIYGDIAYKIETQGSLPL